MDLTDFQKRILWGLGILFILILWITFPLIFKEWIFTLLVKPPFTPEAFATLGPIGDIFGGLTALFTSATLIIVMYSAYLQREANRDARRAMAEQLKQARDATAKQLIQARRSTQEQLELAQKTHEAQLAESKLTNFSNAFYTLLNYKQSRLHSMKVTTPKGAIEPEVIFLEMTKKFLKKLEDWKDENLKNLTRKEVDDEYDNETVLLYDSATVGVELASYYFLYNDLFDLIKQSDLTDEQITFFRNIIFNSMTIIEYYNLIWLSTNLKELSSMIKRHSMFDKLTAEALIPFIEEFHGKGSTAKSKWYK
ncbi:TPA: hypothetical protein R7Q74_002695 [Acinetobacter baumannii]|nr:hypothetical protein [Acinetobacter baumannii]